MHTLEKSLKKDKYPSFSSTLLDEIYRSIDNKEGEQNSCHGGVRKKINNPIQQDEEMSSLNKSAYLIDKWMEKKVNGKNFTHEVPPFLSDFEKDSSIQDNDPLYFSSSSISSDSSSGSGSGGFSSSSDTEFFTASAAATKTLKTSSCFATASWRPKPIKTKVVAVQENVGKSITEQAQKKDTTLIKSRSRAVKIYTNLKNLKQPISPGGRLTSFINSIFSSKTGVVEVEGVKMERKCKSNQTSACSSATSFSRSCLSKTSSTSTSRGNYKIQNNAKRAVSFTVVEMQRSREMDGLKAYKKDDLFDGDDDDAASDCSSDLFEIDHLVLFGNNKRFCEELPVYETTHLNKNLAIASRLVR